MQSLLIVDDDPAIREVLKTFLEREGFRVHGVTSGEAALEVFHPKSFSLVIVDLRLPGMDGLTLIQHLEERWGQVPVLVITGYGSISGAVEAMRAGALDYLVKPFSREDLLRAVRRCLPAEERSWASPRRDRDPYPLITQHPQMLRILRMAETVAASQATVLITGESGTGKELLARFIHARSPRRCRPFVAINCAAIPEGLLESELFGHERGAFTGAVQRKIGRFVAAHQGTLLLDEVGEMGLPLQAKLLRVLQERVVDVVGSVSPVSVDIRVIATTHRDLRAEVRAGRFREDLYYRLNVFPIHLPPLRERREDIPLLAEHFLEKHRYPGPGGGRRARLSREALDRLLAHPWKGNVRELENVMERAILLAEGGTIGPEHLILEGEPTPLPASGGKIPEGPMTVREMERALILRTLEAVKGNRTQAARLLGIGLRTLRNKLREYREEGILPPV